VTSACNDEDDVSPVSSPLFAAEEEEEEVEEEEEKAADIRS